jgi:uncharacterized protein
MDIIVSNLYGVLPKQVKITATFCFLIVLQGGLGGCAAWHDKQRMLAYRPTPGMPADFKGLRQGDAESFVQVPGAQDLVQLWWLPSPDPHAPTLLYLHGTFRNIYQNLPKINAFREAGFSVVVVEYRGWGLSSSITPSELSIYADAEVGWLELVKRQPSPIKRLIYGHSLGGAVAIELASSRHYRMDYGALMVEASFSRLADVIAVRGLFGTMLSWLAVDRFESSAKIKRVDAPILLMHGTSDNTIDIKLGYRLRDAAPADTRFIEIPGGSHSRLFSDAPDVYQRTLHELRERLVNGAESRVPPNSR